MLQAKPKRLCTHKCIDLFEHNTRQYVLIVDYFSKFPFIHKLHNLSTCTVINELKGLFSENGIPEVII